ncbi:hypothetical protein CR513_22306, partial [Mucuna pruriens]
MIILIVAVDYKIEKLYKCTLLEHLPTNGDTRIETRKMLGTLIGFLRRQIEIRCRIEIKTTFGTGRGIKTI